MSFIIVLNGPPGVGKDTLGAYIQNQSGESIKTLSFKAPMFDIAKSMLGANDYDRFLVKYNDRDQKETAQHFLGGKSPREFMIYISENCVKPVLGAAKFGNLFAEAASRYGSVVCTDGGFTDEIMSLVDYGHVVKLVRLHREGYTFDGDSRNYVYLPDYVRVADELSTGYQEFDFDVTPGDPISDASRIIRIVGL